MRIFICLTLTALFLCSCGDKSVDVHSDQVEFTPVEYLPFKKINLGNLSDFEQVSKNWVVAEDVYITKDDQSKLSVIKGDGLLVNRPTESEKDNLFTEFEHGDIEIEFDVLMPKNSNSGLYFQGRYEIQLFDSWGVETPKYYDMGGVYQGDDIEDVKGFVGRAPILNGAKAPGLWQHFKVIFQAPRFDKNGDKIKNALFKKVWLNGMVIHDNVEVTAPTRAAAFLDERANGPLMIQGDHGAVAFKNIKYKLYDQLKVSFSEVKMKEYENGYIILPNLENLKVMREIETDSISAAMATGNRPQRILNYQGSLIIPKKGDYLFDYRLNLGGGLLLIDNDTVINLNGEYTLDSLGYGRKLLSSGKVPFQLIYNKFRPWASGFTLHVEGPNIEKHALHAKGSINLNVGNPEKEIKIDISDKTITQRSFWMFNGDKRTHCISVGSPKGVHYVYDLEKGSLLQAWSGDFIDATKMWFSRGKDQLAEPLGFPISFHGDNDFFLIPKELENDSTLSLVKLQPVGYEFDTIGIPTFKYNIDSVEILDNIVAGTEKRSLIRNILVNSNQLIWHKVAEGKSIEEFSKHNFIVNDESYFINFSNDFELEYKVKKNDEKVELLVRIPTGESLINYSIVW